MKNLFITTVLLYSVAFVSCEKESLDEVDNSNNEIVETHTRDVIGDFDENMVNCVDNDIVTYFLDGEEVIPGTFDPANPELYVLIDGDDDYVDIRAFTTLDGYYDFGDANDIPLETIDNFETEITAYINDNDIIQIFEEEGTVSEDYLAYEAALYNRYFPDGADDRGLVCLYRDLCGGSALYQSSLSPWLGGGFNNTVSSYWPFGIYHLEIVYGRTFYRDRFAPIWRWGGTCVKFISSYGLHWYNDHMSSQINISI